MKRTQLLLKIAILGCFKLNLQAAPTPQITLETETPSTHSKITFSKASQALAGMKHQLNQARALLSRAPLGERAEHQDRIQQLLQLIHEQEQLLNLQNQGETHAEQHVEVMDIDRRPAWLIERQQRGELQLENLPQTKAWRPRWGLSHKRKRQQTSELKQQAPTTASVPWTLNDSKEGLPKDKATAKEQRKLLSKDRPIQKSQFPTAVLAKNGSFVQSSSTIQFPIPLPFRRSAWWLWESQDGQHWTKIRSGWADQNMSLESRPEGFHYYQFTDEEHQPNNEAPHYQFLLDTTPPDITTFETQTNEQQHTVLHWKLSDHWDPHPQSTLTIYGQNKSVLLTNSPCSNHGNLTLIPEQFRGASWAEITTKDKAGNHHRRAVLLQ